MDVRSQDTPSQNLEKLDMSKENSSISTRSDQTTLEYQDAPSPEDFEDIFMATKPASSSTELIPNLTEQTEKDSDNDVFELEVTPPDLEKQMGKNSFPNISKWQLMFLNTICDRIFSIIRKASGLNNCVIMVC